MKILVIGGTRFLGKHFTILAREAGHTVTHFNRGQFGPDVFPDIETLTGDRDGGLEALAGRSWDAALDTCGYVPRVVGDSARLLADSVDHYTFVSSISVYKSFTELNQDESAPVGTLDDESVETIDGETYGPLKALCEQAAEKAMPGRVLISRPGLIVGPDDHSFRFPYWVDRLMKGGDVLAPGRPGRPMQIIDVRDLAAWTLARMEDRTAGCFNVTGPEGHLGFGEFLDRSIRALSSDAALTWIPDDFLVEHGVDEWVEMPLWIPGDEWSGLERMDISKARETGLSFRTIEETVRGTAEWIRSLPADYERKAGLAAKKESQVLESWRGRPTT